MDILFSTKKALKKVMMQGESHCNQEKRHCDHKRACKNTDLGYKSMFIHYPNYEFERKTDYVIRNECKSATAALNCTNVKFLMIIYA